MSQSQRPTEEERPRKPLVVLPIADHRKARHDYEILEKFEAGLLLAGAEVKSLRAGQVQFEGAFARLDEKDEAWLVGLYIGPYKQRSSAFAALHEKRERKLLLNKGEINKIRAKYEVRGLTLIPLRLYFKGPWAKIEIAACRGKTHGDKRATLKNRELTREAQAAMNAKRR